MKRTLCLLATTLALASAVEVEQGMPLVETAMEFLGRASTTSEVLTLNLTNLLILLALKALIFGFGLFSVGGGGGVGGIGRALDEDATPWITPAELTGGMCFLMYNAGAEDKMECIQRTVCEEPYLMNDYLTAGKMWWKGHELLSNFIPFEEKYQRIAHKVEAAINHGKEGHNCAAKYHW